jgi:PAS domain S-box-containing protein
LLDQIGNAVLAVNCQGRILYGNRAAQSLFQWSAQVMVGAAIDRLLEPKVLEAIAAGQDTVESEGRTWSGGRFPAAIAITPITDESGSATSMLLVVTDLTQRHALDLQLMHSSRLATLGEMAASIAHEFNQCLHVIRLASEALRLDLNDGRMDIERFTRRADNILSQVDRLTEMVMQMRTISRRDGDGKRPFRPQQAVDAAIRMVAPLLQADGIKVVREGDLGNVAVLGHPVRLEQLVLNIMINARDAIQDRMRLKGGGGTVIVRCTADAKDVTITVRDDGIGVPEAIGHHIFDPFVTTKDGSRGCGLGLSISRGICTEMGGSLSFANLEDGTVFTIVLPLAAAEPALAPESEAAASNIADDEDSEAHQRRLLVVDDEALSVMMVSEFLERQGYAVDAAYDGIEALTLCGQHVYDAVITDIRMPRMDGRALIKHLAELQPGTPVIVVTGHLKQGSAAELGDNVQAVLPKPFQLLHLRDQLNQLEAAIPRSDHHPVEEE